MQRPLAAGADTWFWLIGPDSSHLRRAGAATSITTPAGSAAVEQTTPGTRPPAVLVESFDGLGVGFEGPQGTTNVRNPSDNTLAVGPDHIVQIVNSQTAIFTKKGRRFDDDRSRPVRTRQHGELLQRFWWPVRGDQQR